MDKKLGVDFLFEGNHWAIDKARFRKNKKPLQSISLCLPQPVMNHKGSVREAWPPTIPHPNI